MRMLFSMLLSLFIAYSQLGRLEAVTSKLNDISLIEKYAGEDTLVCWSVENVLCTPTSMLGSMQRVASFRSGEIVSSLPEEEVDKKAVDEWVAVNNLCGHSIIHPSVTNTLIALSLKKVDMLGISVADLTSAASILDTLERNEIFLEKSGARFPNIFIKNPDYREECLRSLLLEENILFTGSMAANTTVGKAFSLFLNSLNTKPARVIYVDGNPEDILSMEEVCEAANIYFIGVSFKSSEKKLRGYDNVVADLQKTLLLDQLSDAFFTNILSSLQSKTGAIKKASCIEILQDF
ncbi:DUF2608 domain-containing protein [Chlamydiifrater phoenicopteri]|uniref:DUF2608 domain-containing protein n=1 Tax=Chlamydiifrater phoenicopteri TaxID=2681469 RepID=UPI001BCCD56F|nr:DUF2608 domain-containing protein [Chlamydiifrater phoenicopteri]